MVPHTYFFKLLIVSFTIRIDQPEKSERNSRENTWKSFLKKFENFYENFPSQPLTLPCFEKKSFLQIPFLDILSHNPNPQG